ncbi:MAG: hypothetical protein HXX17_00030 [Geobacteraceae bacterium]|nr:hypothetical protein [Geobacteraceae bacterium]
MNRFLFSRHFQVVSISLLFGCLLFLQRAEAFTLSVTNHGAGAGNISGDVSCSIAPLGQCSATLTGGTVTLTANSDWKSLFIGWGAPCSGTGGCSFTVAADTDVAVTFTPNYQAIIVGHSISPNYTTLADAYAAANDQYIVAANVYTFYEELVLNLPKYVRLYLGKEPGFYGFPAIGFTTIQGSLTVQNGAVEIDALIIQ